jgi:predicted nucleotide-binding protein
MVPNNVREEMADFPREVNRKIAKLKSIKERLPLWADEIPMTGVHADIDEDGPIFVVHGSNLTRAEQVARFVDRSTGREAVILHEQANQGRTLLEKFEHHAHATSFAVVLLTADDEGRRVGDDELRPRGRQNVVLELGFFLSRLGRDHVVVVLDPGVETPSDIAGLVYVTLDEGGVWKQKLSRELQTAGISVDVARIP